MSKRLGKNQPFLHMLSRTKSTRRRKALIKQATRDELATLFEICFNILRGNLPLKSHMKKKLKRERHTLRTLADKKISLKHKKKVANQKGGLLGTVASIALPLIASLLLKK